MATRLLFALILACTACGGTTPAPQPEPEPCPAECTVQWSERYYQTFIVGKMVSGLWRYRGHEVCDDRCRYRGEPPTCNVQVEAAPMRPRRVQETAIDDDRP